MSKLIDVPQGSSEWLAARAGLATASHFGDVMSQGRGNAQSITRKAYATEVAIERLTGKKTEIFQTWDMKRGIEQEPLARLWYTLQTGNVVEQTSLWVHDELEVGATPDGFVGTDGTIEIKNPRPHNHLEALQTGQVPYQYRWQVQGQLWLAERQWCDFVSCCMDFPEGSRLAIVRVTRDDNAIANLEAECRSFLSEVGEITKFISNYGQTAAVEVVR